VVAAQNDGMDFMLHNPCHLTHGNCHAAARDPRWRIGIESVDGETPVLMPSAALLLSGDTIFIYP
jgi:hypothetical protein